MEQNLFFAHIGCNDPLFGPNKSSFKQSAMQSVELVDKNFVNFGAFPARVEVLQSFIDVPVEPR